MPIKRLSQDAIGTKVEVNYNTYLHLFTVRIDRNILGHTPSLVLHNVSFLVQEEKQKQAKKHNKFIYHAFAYGTLVSFNQALEIPGTAERVSYDFRENPFFYRVALGKNTPCYRGKHVYCIMENNKGSVYVDHVNIYTFSEK